MSKWDNLSSHTWSCILHAQFLLCYIHFYLFLVSLHAFIWFYTFYDIVFDLDWVNWTLPIKWWTNREQLCDWMTHPPWHRIGGLDWVLFFSWAVAGERRTIKGREKETRGATDVRGFAPQKICCSLSFEPVDRDYLLEQRGCTGWKVQLRRGNRRTTAGRARRRWQRLGSTHSIMISKGTWTKLLWERVCYYWLNCHLIEDIYLFLLQQLRLQGPGRSGVTEAESRQLQDLFSPSCHTDLSIPFPLIIYRPSSSEDILRTFYPIFNIMGCHSPLLK